MMIKVGDYQLRSFQDSDLEDLVSAANNKKIARYLTNMFPHPYTKQDGLDWLEICKSEKGEIRFAIATDSKLIGGFGFLPRSDIHAQTMGMGYWLSEDYWGKGVMTQVVGSMSDYVFETYPDIVRLEAMVYEGNEGSKRVLEKNGFVCEACLKKNVTKYDKVYDAFIYARIKE
jgi:[ribosomal protein S5]-alanine N-acetyltransferase